MESLGQESVAWIRGLSWVTDSYWMGDRPLQTMTSLEWAATKSYRMAGVSNPIEELDVIEIQDVSAYHELMAYEALGLCDPGKAWRLVENGNTDFNGRVPVNPSGGTLCANPYFVTGLVRVVETALQFMGRAGNHQVPGVKIGLASTNCGFACQGGSVFVLSSEPG